MDKFCGSRFWDEDLTWNTADPDLTPCFQNTVLIWAPCIFLGTFSFLEVHYLVHSKRRNIPYSWKFCSKGCLTLSLIALSIIDLSVAIRDSFHTEVYSVSYVTPCIKIISFVCAAAFLFHNKRCGMRTSGLLFQFWFLLSLCGVVQFRSLLKNRDDSSERSYPFVSYMIYYSMVLVMFLLNFWVDDEPKFSFYPPVEKPCPEGKASYFSRLLFAWFDPLAYKGYKKPLETSNLWSINPEDETAEIISRFDKYWDRIVNKYHISKIPRTLFRESREHIPNDPRKNKTASILYPLYMAFGPTFLFGAILESLQDVMIFIGPQLLKLLIEFVEGSEPGWKGYLYSLLFLVTAVFQMLVLAQYSYRMSMVGLRIRTALVAAIYRKALKISNAARKQFTVGEIVNLMSVDAQKFMDLTPYISTLWSAPIQIILALYFLWNELGIALISGLIIMVTLAPINAVLARQEQKLQTQQMETKDERIKLINEVLNGIKVLKLYAWEPSFERKILAIRTKEIQLIKKEAYIDGGMDFIWSCAPFLVSFASFATYVYIDNTHVLNNTKAFVSLSLFNIMQVPLSMLPYMISALIQASVSVKRINTFMNAEELDPNAVGHDQFEEKALIIENGIFSWDTESSDNLTLKNINLQVESGELMAIVGSVGSGKSSLISAFLGEINRVSGRVNVKGSVAYVSQQAWIQNATVQENVLFGKTLNEDFYARVMKACALELDMEMLPAGDQTEIGEKGINLSGGQKQRLALARAIYSNSDVYFLDDPLSAVDTHVGKHIFENAIGPNGLLHGKTRVLVTHAITYLPDVDNVFVLDNGEIMETGTYDQLMEKRGAFRDFLVHHLQEVKPEVNASGDSMEIDPETVSTVSTVELQQKLSRQLSTSSMAHSDSSSTTNLLAAQNLLRQQSTTSRESNNLEHNTIMKKGNVKFAKVGATIIDEEKSEIGNVKLKIYAHYLKSIGWFLSISIILMLAVLHTLETGSYLWITKWSNDNATVINNVTNKAKRDMYVGVYGAFGLGQCIMVLGVTITLAYGSVKASDNLFRQMLSNILKGPMSFFDCTPCGRLLNRFGEDIEVVDNTLPHLLRYWITCVFGVIATLLVISISTPKFGFVILPIGALYYFVQRFYIPTSGQLKRLESVSRSPIYSHFGESVTGAQTIRAYGEQERFIHESEHRVNQNQMCKYPGIIANIWLSLRLEMLGNMIVFFAALFAISERGTLNAGLVGLSVSFALQITQTLNWIVRMTSEVETNIVAVERIKEYIETPQEAPWTVRDKTPDEKWPSEGRIEFRDFKIRYREGLDFVLNGLTLTVNSGEKIGIVGRTGAGKSSLTLALFRIIEATEGKIFIDGIDISQLGLHALRSRLTIIPQDPVLFSGTLRLNLDPFDKYTDLEVWEALEHANLKSFVLSFEEGLSHVVSEGGDNLSVGQRQLICLARALLRRTRILILDEATAAVDLETDELIQRTIRQEFKECTILTIAHRLNTIIDYDRVLVLDKGIVAEFDSPDTLLQQPTSAFKSMVKDAGLIT